jgi:hypothetical protein
VTGRPYGRRVRLPALAALLLVAACTSAPAARPATPAHAVPSRAAPSSAVPSSAAARPWRAPYVSDLVAGARHTLVSAGARVHVLDDAGHDTGAQWVPGGGWPRLVRGADGTTYAVAVGADGLDERLHRYAGGRFRRVDGGPGSYPERFSSGADVYRLNDTWLLRDTPRRAARRWQLPETPQLRSDAHGFIGLGDDPYEDVGRPLLVVTTPSGPVVVVALDARCAVTHLGTGRQVVLDAPPPYEYEFCGSAAVAPDGRLAVLARDSGAEDRLDRLVLVSVDPVTLAVTRRVLPVPLGRAQSFGGSLVALPGGLVAYLRDRTTPYVVDLRPARPVVHRLPARAADDYSYGQVAAAGPDALFVWGNGRTVDRLDVRTGRLDAAYLRLPAYVDSVLRDR